MACRDGCGCPQEARDVRAALADPDGGDRG